MAYRILIVDDSRLARMAVIRALNALRPDWERVEASNADEALACAKHGHIDVALLDFNMPGRDGLTLAAELQALYPALPVAVISANLQHEVVSRAAAIGAAFLPKPLTAEALAGFLADAAQRLGA
jgi:DNA-binding NarL/FixJ family response regulator